MAIATPTYTPAPSGGMQINPDANFKGAQPPAPSSPASNLGSNADGIPGNWTTDATGKESLTPVSQSSQVPDAGSSSGVSPDTYSRLGTNLPTGVTQDQVDAAQAAQYATEDPALAAQNYKTSALKTSQDQINSINDTYAKELADQLATQAGVNANNEGRTRALSALMGLSGSSSADTRASVAEKASANANQAITDKVMAEKTAALNAIYDKIDQGSQVAYTAQQTTNKQNQDALLKQVSSNALDSLKAIAAHVAPMGQSFDSFKNADGGVALQKIMQQTGMNEFQLRQIWNQSLPANLQPITQTAYADNGQGGTTMTQYNVDPVTHKTSVTTTDIAGVPPSVFNGPDKPIATGGMLLVKQADGSYKDVSPNADLNRSKAQADIAKTQADTAKENADTAAAGGGLNDVSLIDGTGKTVQIPADAAPYFNTSHSGVNYIDASAIQGTASQKKAIIDAAQSAGLKVITNKNTAADLTNINDVFNKLDTIKTVMNNIDQPGYLQRALYGAGMTFFANMLQTNPQQAASGAIQTVGLDILKAISGIQGFRGNQTAIEQVNKHLPSIYDTSAVVAQKLAYMSKLISDREDGILGKNDTAKSLESGATGTSSQDQSTSGQETSTPSGSQSSSEPTDHSKGVVWNNNGVNYVSDGTQWVKQ